MSQVAESMDLWALRLPNGRMPLAMMSDTEHMATRMAALHREPVVVVPVTVQVVVREVGR